MGVHRVGRNGGSRRVVAPVTFAALALCWGGAPTVAAEAPELESSTTTAVTTTTTAVTTTTIAVDPAVPSPTSAVFAPVPGGVPAFPPGVPGVTDAVDEGAADRSAAGQAPFDPASRAVLAAELAGARRRLRALEGRLRTELRAVEASSRDLRSLESAAAEVDATEAARAVEASIARDSLRRAVVGAYLLDGVDVGMVGMLDAVDDLSRARVYLRSLADRRRGALAAFSSARSDLGELGRRLVDRSAPIRTQVREQEARAALVATAVEDARAAVDAYEAGSHVAVDGFRFPVLGPVTFIDSWGFPRMPGTPSAHWHEGTDIIAPRGRELVATEDGVLHGVGEAGLGGTKLWLLGRSGTDYYYAHLSGYAPGVVEGAPVVAGQVIGYVGDTGNARGGVPHLHFEIHPGAAGPVDPYPLLWTSLGRPRLPTESEVLAGPAAVLPPGTTIAP